MSTLPTSVYANSTTPCFDPIGSGGGSSRFPSGINIGPENNDGAILPVQLGVMNMNSQIRVGGGVGFNNAIIDGTAMSFQQDQTGVTFGFATFDDPTGAIDLANIKSISPNTAAVQVVGGVQANSYDVDINGIQVPQPKVQYGSVSTSGSSGNVTITLPQTYTSVSSYVAIPVMEDTNAAEMSANRTGANTFDIYWQSGGGGAHTIAWLTAGL